MLWRSAAGVVIATFALLGRVLVVAAASALVLWGLLGILAGPPDKLLYPFPPDQARIAVWNLHISACLYGGSPALAVALFARRRPWLQVATPALVSALVLLSALPGQKDWRTPGVECSALLLAGGALQSLGLARRRL